MILTACNKEEHFERAECRGFKSHLGEHFFMTVLQFKVAGKLKDVQGHLLPLLLVPILLRTGFLLSCTPFS